jgi:hypothetical protein
MMTAGIASANGPGHGGPGGPGNDGGGPGGNAIVAADGTIFVTRTVTDSGTNTATTTLKAITPAGSVAWTVTLTDRGHLLLSGSNLLSVSESETNDVYTSTITARATSTGAVAWTATINGHITDLTPFNGGTYAIVVVPAATTGGTATRSLVAISNSGATLWTVAL